MFKTCLQRVSNTRISLLFPADAALPWIRPGSIVHSGGSFLIQLPDVNTWTAKIREEGCLLTPIFYYGCVT